MPIAFAALSALTWGVADFFGGVVTKRVPAMVVVMWSQLAGLAMAALMAPFFGGPGLTGPVLVWGAAGGLAGSFGLVWLYKGLATGAMAVVAPVSAVFAAALPIGVGLLVGERPDLLAWLGIFLALPAIWLVSRHGAGESGGRGLGAGLAAGVGFGLFFVFLSFAPTDAGLWPLVPARLASVVAITTLLGVRRAPVATPAPTRIPVAAIGFGDMAANMFFLIAVQRGLLALVSVVSSFYPVFTVLLARLVLAEEVGRRRWAGIALALVALALISA